MILPALLTLMAFAAVIGLAWPLMRRTRPAPPRAEFERAVLADQLVEVDRDLDRGVIDASQAEAARAEIGRRALARLGDAGDGSPAQPPPASPGRRGWAKALAVALPVAAGALYVAVGRPDLPGQPFAARPQPQVPAEAPPPETMTAVAGLIAARVRQEPTVVEGWRLLMRIHQRFGERDTPRRLYDEVIAAADDPARRAAIALAYGEAAMLAGDGSLNAEARAAFATALAAEPANPAARYYQGLAQVQAGDPEGAYETWSKLRADAPADAPWRQQIDDDIARLKTEHGVGP